MRQVGILALLSAVLAVTGCYTHTVVPRGEVTPGADVRVRVSAAHAQRLRPVFGHERRVLQGAVVENGADGLLLQVAAARDPAGRKLQQRVTVPDSSLLELEVRRLDGWRTAGVIGAAVAVGGYLLSTQFEGTDPSDSGAPGKGGSDQAVVRLLRWSW